MNRKQEILWNYRENTVTIKLLEEHLDQVSDSRYIGGPRPIRSPQLTGMPRGTNEPEAAMMQTIDTESDLISRLVSRIRENKAVQFETMQQALDIVDAIEDKLLYNIVYAYYILGYTDQQIANSRYAEDEDPKRTSLSRQSVQKKRSDYFNSLA